MSHRRTPSQSRGHSRMKSDDYKLLLDSDGSPTFHQEQELGNDPLENPLPVLLQPKFQCVNCVAVFFGPFLGQFRGRGGDWIKIFTNPISSLVILFLAIAIPAGLGSLAYFINKPHIDMSLQSFEIPNHVASERSDAFHQALTATHKFKLHPHLGKRRKRSLFNSYPDAWPKTFPRLKTPIPTTKPVDPDEYRQKYERGSFDLVYLATGDEDDNIFTKERLETIHRVEQQIMKREGFTEFCWRWPVVRQDPFLNDRFNACTPPISLIDFFFPSNNKYFDGQGNQNLTETSIQETLTFLLSKGFTYWFVDDKFSETHKKSRFLRAQVKFGFPLRGFPVHGSTYQSSVQSDMRKKFMIGYIETLQKASTDKVQVLYGGTTIFDYEVKAALQNDVRLVQWTFTIVGILLLALTSFSFFLMVWGILSIVSSVLLALAAFLVVFKIKTLGILDAVSLFVILGIGVDDVFVFINTFRQARHAKNLDERMRYTILTAGKATFFTSFTTAAAFAANCLSQMPAVHDFGLFMALIVSMCWLTVVVTIPPALNIWYRYIAWLEAWVARKLGRLLPCSFGSGASSLPASIIHFLSGHDSSVERQQESIPLQQIPANLVAIQDSNQTNYDMDIQETSLQLTSDDEDLLQMPEEDQGTVPLLPAQNSLLVQERSDSNLISEGFNCGSKLQEILFHFVAIPILKGRYVILVLFVAILGSSLWLNTRIQASEKPPQFFRKDTNLQQLLDLQFNMSADNYDCKICNDVINTGNAILTNQGSNNKPATAPPPPPTVHHPKTHAPPPTEMNRPSIEDKVTTRKTTAQMGKNPTAATSSTQQPTSKKKTLYTSVFQSTHLPTSKFVLTSSKTSTMRTTLKPATTAVPPETTRKPTRHRRPVVTQPKTAKPTTLGNGVIDNNNVQTIPTTGPALCATTADCKPIDKPIVASTAIVYVVFGVKGINRTGVGVDHVIKSKGSAVLDDVFSNMVINKETRWDVLNTLCKICKAFANNHELVKPGGADCFPYLNLVKNLMMRSPNHNKDKNECETIPKPNFVAGASTRSELRWANKPNLTLIMAMAFESTTFMGKSSKLVYKDYMKWEQFLKDTLKGKSAAFDSAFQTSDEWVKMFTEIIAVNSAVYGIVISLCLCVAAVVIFTGHFMLALIVMLTILGVLSTVVAIFYLAGWQLGAVEAISLSILVGTSVDYCVHLIEGYILAGNALPNLPSNKERRCWRSSAAVAHIGSSILSSALTTILAAVPLCFTTIQFFTKFGMIVAINTAMSIVYTFTVCIAMLGFMAPAKFRSSWKAFSIALLGTLGFSAVSVLTLYLISIKLMPIPGPGGSPLFSGSKQ